MGITHFLAHRPNVHDSIPESHIYLASLARRKKVVVVNLYWSLNCSELYGAEEGEKEREHYGCSYALRKPH